jgi:lipid II:glycine glycyltransferase (peptidoglycan interpeptide bridge formation enzyme)
MGISVMRTLPEEGWRHFVEEHPAGNIFHTPEMFRVFALARGHQPSLWAAVNDDGRPLALLLPVQITLLGGVLRRLTTRAVAYGSVLCAPGPDGQQALATLLRAYEQGIGTRALFTELRNLSDMGGLQPVLDRCGFAFEDHLNYLVDLEQPKEVIWRKINEGGRKNLRRSGSKGTLVEEVAGRHQLRGVYQLLRETYTRVRIPLPSSSLFQAAFDILFPLGMLKIFVARVGDRYLGARLLLAYKGRLIDWYAGDNRGFSAYYLNESLVWHALQWGQEHDYRLFDFGGAGKPNEHYGPRDFKAKFGGQLVNYGRNTCIHAPTRFRLSQTGYQAMRRYLWRRHRIPAKGNE